MQENKIKNHYDTPMDLFSNLWEERMLALFEKQIEDAYFVLWEEMKGRKVDDITAHAYESRLEELLKPSPFYKRIHSIKMTVDRYNGKATFAIKLKFSELNFYLG